MRLKNLNIYERPVYRENGIVKEYVGRIEWENESEDTVSLNLSAETIEKLLTACLPEFERVLKDKRDEMMHYLGISQ